MKIFGSKMFKFEMSQKFTGLDFVNFAHICKIGDFRSYLIKIGYIQNNMGIKLAI